MNTRKAMLYSAIASLSKLLSGLVVVKVIALTLGPGALGLVGQFMSVVAILVVLSTGGTSIGVSRCIAERYNDRLGFSRIVRTACMFSVFICTSIILMTIFNSKYFSLLLFGSTEYSWTLILSSLLLLPIAFSTIGQAVINGQSDIVSLAKVQVGSALIGSVGVFLMVYFYAEHGAVFGLMWVASSPALFVFIWWARHNFLKLSDLMPCFNKSDSLILLRYSGFIIFSIIVQNAVQMWIRLNIESQYGWSEVGYWQAMVRMSDAYLQVFIVFFLAYVFPKFSLQKEPLGSIRIIYDTYKVILVPLLVVLFVGYFLREIVILVFLSDEFMPVSELFFPQMVGDFFKILAFVPGYLVIARGYIPLIVMAELLQGLMLIVLNLILSEQYGAYGAVLAYAVTYIIYFIVSMFFLFAYVVRVKDSVKYKRIEL